MYNILSSQYKVDKYKFIKYRLYTDQPDITIWDPESVYIIFKDY
jgi:hypothetical protein